jgi:hypothetical protein
MFDQSKRIEVALAEIGAALSTLSHKANNQAESIRSITEILWTSNNSVVNQLSLLQNTLSAKAESMKAISHQIDLLDLRMDKAEKGLEVNKSKSNSNSKFVFVLASVLIAYLIPNMLNNINWSASKLESTQIVTKDEH